MEYSAYINSLEMVDSALSLFWEDSIGSFFHRHPTGALRCYLNEHIDSLKDKARKESYSRAYVGNTAAVIIDMQEGFLGGSKRLVPAQTNVIRHFAANNLPVIALAYRTQGRIIRPIREETKKCKKMVYLVKRSDGGFNDTSLEERLKEFGVSNLLLMGVNASGCVWHTAYGALKRGFKIMTASDLIADVGDDSDGSDYPSRYEKSGVWLKDHKDILQIISR